MNAWLSLGAHGGILASLGVPSPWVLSPPLVAVGRACSALTTLHHIWLLLLAIMKKLGEALNSIVTLESRHVQRCIRVDKKNVKENHLALTSLGMTSYCS